LLGVVLSILAVSVPGRAEATASSRDEPCVPGATICVPDDAATIGEALAMASMGDVIGIRPGTYVEPELSLVSDVHLIGAGADVVQIVSTLSAIGLADSTVVADLWLDGSNGGFTGVTIDSTSGLQVRSCRITDFVIGVFATRTDSSIVLGGSLAHANDIISDYLNVAVLETTDYLDATYNYWGTTDFDLVEARLLGLIRYIPITDSTHTQIIFPPTVDVPLLEDSTSGLRVLSNPFVSRVEMSFETRRSGVVALGVFDVRGRLVRSLIDGHQPSGVRSVTWDGRDVRGGVVAPGVYFVRLTSAEHETRYKLIKLLR
jgi:hypothetical protein